MLSSLELTYSSLQTGFLAFAVYLSAIILKTLLQGKYLFWSQWTAPGCHMHDEDNYIDGDGDDCIDGGDDSTDCNGDPTKILTIVLQVPRILPSTSLDSMAMESLVDKLVSPNDIVTNMLFTSSKFSSLNDEVQKCVQVHRMCRLIVVCIFLFCSLLDIITQLIQTYIIGSNDELWSRHLELSCQCSRMLLFWWSDL